MYEQYFQYLFFDQRSYSSFFFELQQNLSMTKTSNSKQLIQKESFKFDVYI